MEVQDNTLIITELIKNLPSIITAIGIIITAYFSYKAQQLGKETVEQGKSNSKAIEVVRADVNDKMQQFIKTSGEAEHAKGMIEGHAAGALESKGTSEDPIHVKVKEEDG